MNLRRNGTRGNPLTGFHASARRHGELEGTDMVNRPNVAGMREMLEAIPAGPWEAYSVPASPGEGECSVVEIDGHEVTLDWLNGSFLVAWFLSTVRTFVPEVIEHVDRLESQILDGRDLLTNLADEWDKRGQDGDTSLQEAARELRQTLAKHQPKG